MTFPSRALIPAIGQVTGTGSFRAVSDRESQEDLVEIVAIVLRLQTNLVRDRCREAESVIPAVISGPYSSRVFLTTCAYRILLSILLFCLENLR